MDGPDQVLSLGSLTHVGKAARLWPGRSSSCTRRRDRLSCPRSPNVPGRNFSRNTSTLAQRLVLLPETYPRCAVPRFSEPSHERQTFPCLEQNRSEERRVG